MILYLNYEKFVKSILCKIYIRSYLNLTDEIMSKSIVIDFSTVGVLLINCFSRTYRYLVNH